MLGVRNVHARTLRAPAAAVGALIDTLASDDDRLWPHDRWPAMRLDRALAIGARGGHGPVRYRVEDYRPGQCVRFAFEAPRGFHGWHGFHLEAGGGHARLVHVLEMRIAGPALLSWPLLFRPLHDALLEDALDRAALALGDAPERQPWSPWVRLLRALLRHRRQSRRNER
ncbi:MAG: hypothetical protein ACK4RW_04065 [Rehaibacterium terrae]|uniref:hypothetical protein n=1 Tax=Rehaibacterium terrae TaxID=1341696 RepID=UPI00391C8164